MPKQSAGILIFKFEDKELYVLLVHPGGPYWVGKDSGAWSIPKGEFGKDEEPLRAARREVEEETGMKIQIENAKKLTPVRLKSGKQVYAWAVEGDADPAKIKSNAFKIEWPPGSGSKQSFPEVNKACWYNMAEAKEKINSAQIPLLDELSTLLKHK